MMKKSLFLILLGLTVIYGQNKINNYRLLSEMKTLAKATDSAPASNTINDILTVGDTVWVATSRGLSKTTDNGASWTTFYGNADFGTESVSALAYDKTTHSIWASLAHSTDVSGSSLPEGAGLRFSTDGGATWKNIPQPLDDPSDTIEIYGANRLHALPVTVKIQNITYNIAITPNEVWIASFAGGLRKNRIDSLIANPLAHFKRVVLPPDSKYSIKPTDTLNFCLSPVAGNYCSDNNLNYRVFSLVSVDDSILYVGTADGINKTTDALKAPYTNDMAWVKFNHQQNADSSISGNFVVSLTYDAQSTPKTLWAVTWMAEDNTEQNGVSFTQNDGAYWQKTLLNHKAYKVATYGNIAVAPSDDGPFRSTNFGNSWILPGQIIDSKTNASIKSSAFFSGSFSPNGTNLWLGSGEGLAEQIGYAPTWTNNWRIYFASQKLSGSSDAHAFPNPFSPRTDICKIKYTTGGSTQQVTVRIFSFSMKYIRTIIRNVDRCYPSTGTYSDGVTATSDATRETWDGKDDAGNIVPNGVYFYRIDVGSKDPIFGKIMVLQ
jgi:hypothetical protein